MFGRRRRAKRARLEEDLAFAGLETAEEVELPEAGTGPYDSVGPDDGRARLDLGSLLLPVPEGAQLQIEVGQTGPVRAVHLRTPLGQFTVTAFAAPRSAGLWGEVAGELITRLRTEGATVRLHTEEFGREVEAVSPVAELRFIAVDGPRWLLRGVWAGHGEQAAGSAQAVPLLREVLRETVVLRGTEPLPPRTPLPIVLPEALAEQIKQASAAQAADGTTA